MRGLRSVALFLGLAVLPGLAGAEGVTLAIRSDAPPFAERTGEGSYAGFLVEICEAAVAGAGYTVAGRRPITAGERATAIGDNSVDLVCDPMTITLARAEQVDFSPIVFVANSGLYRRDEPRALLPAALDGADACAESHTADPGRRLVGVGMVGGTTANATYALARDSGILGETLDYGLCPVTFASHAEGIAALCDGQIGFYVGDLDIIRAEIDRRKGCAASQHQDFGAYEPYALAMPGADDGFRRAFVTALYGLYADGSVLDFYREAFGTDRLSKSNEMLFGLYKLPRGEEP